MLLDIDLADGTEIDVAGLCEHFAARMPGFVILYDDTFAREARELEALIEQRQRLGHKHNRELLLGSLRNKAAALGPGKDIGFLYGEKAVVHGRICRKQVTLVVEPECPESLVQEIEAVLNQAGYGAVKRIATRDDSPALRPESQ